MTSETTFARTERVEVHDLFVNVAIAARIGDAMGTPTENLSAEEIQARFGWVSTFHGDGTDDSLMADILAGALHGSDGYATVDEWGAQLVAHSAEILGKSQFFFASVLHLLNKLNRGYRATEVAFGNMPSSSSAMCIWPVALVNPANPHAAAKQAYELAALIQIAPVDHCADAAAALAAAISSALSPGADVDAAVDDALEVIRPISGKAFRDTLIAAIDLARTSGSYESFRATYQERFARPIACDAMETVPAAFALAVLARGDVKTAVEYGANFGRDSDTIACMAGALTGALTDKLPPEWLAALSPAELSSAEKIATDILRTAQSKYSIEQSRLQSTAEFLGTF